MGRKSEVELSLRLSALASMVTPGSQVCDLGCDHGFLSIYLVQKKISSRVIAMDVRKGPLQGAVEHISEYKLGAYIDTRISDGLFELKAGEADCLVCAGMGGRLMQRILIEGREKANAMKELILQPQSQVEEFRKFLGREGYRTVSENMIEEEGKFYPMMKAVPAGEAIICREPLYDRYGEILLKEKNPVLKRFLELQWKKKKEILEELKTESGSGSRLRLKELEEELSEIERALSGYGIE